MNDVVKEGSEDCSSSSNLSGSSSIGEKEVNYSSSIEEGLDCVDSDDKDFCGFSNEISLSLET